MQFVLRSRDFALYAVTVLCHVSDSHTFSRPLYQTGAIINSYRTVPYRKAKMGELQYFLAVLISLQGFTFVRTGQLPLQNLCRKILRKFCYIYK